MLGTSNRFDEYIMRAMMMLTRRIVLATSRNSRMFFLGNQTNLSILLRKMEGNQAGNIDHPKGMVSSHICFCNDRSMNSNVNYNMLSTTKIFSIYMATENEQHRYSMNWNPRQKENVLSS